MPIDTRFKDKPYIFFSYAHQNTRKPGRILSILREEGFLVWYDDGLQPGDRYNQIIDVMIRNCAVFMPVLTKEYCESDYCSHELIYSQEYLKKPMIPVFLEHPSALMKHYPPGLGLWLSGRSGIITEDTEDLTFFRNQIRKITMLSPCRQVQQTQNTKGTQEQTSVRQTREAQQTKETRQQISVRQTRETQNTRGTQETASFDQVLQAARNELLEKIAQLPPEAAGKAGQLLIEAEACYKKGRFVDSVNTLHFCSRELTRGQGPAAEPAYLCWRLAESYLQSGSESSARRYYERAVKENPEMHNAGMEEKLRNLKQAHARELQQMQKKIQDIPSFVREQWEQELQSLFDQYEQEHPLTSEDSKTIQEVVNGIKNPGADRSHLITVIGPLSKKNPRAEYLAGQIFDSIDQSGHLAYWGCGRLLGKYPAGLCLKGVESSIHKNDIFDARSYYNRLKFAARGIVEL